MKFKDILEFVSNKNSVPKEQILSPLRTAPVAQARQELMCMAKNNGYTIPEICKLIDRDYSSVLYGIQKHKERLSNPKKKKSPYHHLSYAEITERMKDDDDLRQRRRVRDQLRYMDIKIGSMSELLHEKLTEEVMDYVINSTIADRYETVAEFVADCVTECFFNQKK